MFLELDLVWKQSTLSQITHIIHPTWSDHLLKRTMITKKSTSFYHHYALNRGINRERLFKLGKSSTPLCRFGCGCNESVVYMFLECPKYHDFRKAIFKALYKFNLPFTLSNTFCHTKLKADVEQFIIKVHELWA